MRLWRGCGVLLLLAAAGTAGSCANAERSPALVAAVRAVLDAKPPAGTKPAVWKDVRAFYDQRAAAAWVGASGPSKRAALGLRILRAAPDHGLAAKDYGEPEVATLLDTLERGKDDAPDRLQQLAGFDVRLTSALLALGREVAMGRARPESISGTWKARRTAPDFAGTLNRAIDDDLAAWLDGIRPAHPEYAALQTALRGLYDLQEQGAPPPGAPAASGAPRAPGAAATPPAVPSLDDQIKAVRVNMDRWRWMPDTFGERHLLVNIPYYHVIAREQGKQVFVSRVVVGKPATRTPIFSAKMTTVIFSPYWHIPDTIVVGETAPAAVRDPAYLTRNQIEILRVGDAGGTRVNPSTVNWDDPDELKSLAFRQRPGAANALGHVKFLFPNPFDVYLHDTPADQLFERSGRAFSHGCIRVAEPQALAEYVLRGHPDWPRERIVQAMRAGVEKAVPLKEGIPVHVVYFTAWVDEAGALQLGPDIYGYDAAHRRSL
jgi:murein L,D-transpeptidase YcbB/YkuD